VGLRAGRRDLVEEATALGAVITGGVGAGLFDSVDVAQRLAENHEGSSPWRQ
jgi:hypothetical protein